MKRTSGNGRYLFPSASSSNHPNVLPQRCSLIAEREIPRGQTFRRDLPGAGPLINEAGLSSMFIDPCIENATSHLAPALAEP
jgi:hypothetical protein